MSGPDWYRWFPAKWASGVIGLTPEQRGVYIDIINIILDRGACPEDYDYLKRACNCQARRLKRLIRELIAAGKLERNNGLIRQHRAETERRESEAFAEVQAQRVRNRWQESRQNKHLDDTISGTATPQPGFGESLAQTLPKQLRNISETDPPLCKDNNDLAHTLTTTTTKKNPIVPSLFELEAPENGLDLEAAFATWWSVYPRKVGKRKAEALWRRLVTKREVTVEALQEAVSAFAVASEGTEARYVPHPTTWLSGGRWADEEHSMSDTVEPLSGRLKSKTIDQIIEGLAFWRDNAHRHAGEEAYQHTLAAYEAEAERRDLVVPP